MLRLLHSIVLCLALGFSCLNVFSQNELDSLEGALSGATRVDSARTLVLIAFHSRREHLEEGRKAAEQATRLAIDLKNDRLHGKSLEQQYWYAKRSAEFTRGIVLADSMLVIAHRIPDDTMKAISHFALGALYSFLGDIDRAKENCLIALPIYERLGRDHDVAAIKNNLGDLYSASGEFEKGLAFHREVLAFFESKQDTFRSAVSLMNIGVALANIGKQEEAIKMFHQSKDLAYKIGDLEGVGYCLRNLGHSYAEVKRYDEALLTLHESLGICGKLNDNYGIAYTQSLLGMTHSLLEQTDSSIYYYSKAIETLEDVGSLKLYHTAYDGLSESYAKLGDYAKAYEYAQLKYEINDSIISVEKIKLRGELESKYELDRRELEIDNLNKEKALDKKELERKQFQVWGFAGAVLLLVGLAIAVLIGYRNKKRDNEVIAHQKALVDEKQKEILDSINYAKRIQGAILPTSDILNQYLQNGFVLYLPKDIVAGDFYWMHTLNDGSVLVAAADCTGHGVPGAMVSVVCNNALNQTVREYGLTSPGKILDQARELVVSQFEYSDEVVKDGMDISLCKVNIATGEVAWSGANNPLWIIREGATEVEEIKPTKQAVGHVFNPVSFEEHQIKLNKGDSIFLLSDGYIDQFGGPNGKKYKSRQLKHSLLEINHMEMDAQKVELHERLKKWMGDLDQLDDICVIGVRV